MAERRYPAGALLRQINDLALDPGYQHARGRAGRSEASRLRRSVVLAALFVAVGVTAGAAAAQLRTVPSESRARAVLVEQIERRDSLADELTARNELVRAQIDTAEDSLLGEDGGRAEELVSLEIAAGARAVEGPGLVVVLTDAPVDELTGERTDPMSRVQDTDLQTVANGLWLSGAEAIAINGQRLTALSAIRGAGDAILVDFRPLAPPYRVEAVGDPEAFTVELATGGTGRYAVFLRDNYGIGVSVERAGELRLPAAASLSLQHAQPVATDREGVGTGGSGEVGAERAGLGEDSSAPPEEPQQPGDGGPGGVP